MAGGDGGARRGAGKSGSARERARAFGTDRHAHTRMAAARGRACAAGAGRGDAYIGDRVVHGRRSRSTQAGTIASLNWRQRHKKIGASDCELIHDSIWQIPIRRSQQAHRCRPALRHIDTSALRRGESSGSPPLWRRDVLRPALVFWLRLHWRSGSRCALFSLCLLLLVESVSPPLCVHTVLPPFVPKRWTAHLS